MVAKRDTISDYRHDATRKNNPPAALASQGRVREIPKQRYHYDPHLPPALRFDETGESDRLPELLQEATRRKLTAEEADILADALRNHQPWLEWTGKREKRWFEVDTVALHIHERVSARAIMQVAARQDVQRGLWADPEQDYYEAVQFYRHDVDWANRLILGDSLAVMNSLAKREDLAGKVQMIYVDPPYGIRFGSNFQPFVRNRSVSDRDTDLTREPEMVKAYRDTWSLGLHSYLSYLRDRLIIARELLTDTGSIFLQIGDENVHQVRTAMDEVFGKDNFISQIAFSKTGGFASDFFTGVFDFLLHYSKDRKQTKFRKLYGDKLQSRSGLGNYSVVEELDGSIRRISSTEKDDPSSLPTGAQLFGVHSLTSGGGNSLNQPYEFQGRVYNLKARDNWKASYPLGMDRLSRAERINGTPKRIGYKRYFNDFPVIELNNLWNDTRGEMDMRYVV